MLFRQNLGRCHHRRLIPALDGREHRCDGDDGLAGTDLALQQSVHGVGHGHVGLDLVDDALLGRGEPVREGVEKGAGQLPRSIVRHPDRIRHLHLLLHGEGHLEPEELVEHQAPPGRSDDLRGFREMDVRERGVPIDEIEAIQDLLGHDLVDRP